MDDPLENPLGLQGIEFIEFASLTPGLLERAFVTLGFVEVARHRSHGSTLFRQGGIDFIVNNQPECLDACFATEQGPSVSGLGIRVQDARVAFAHALDLGAAPMEACTAPVAGVVPPLQGIGGIPLYLVERCDNGNSRYDDFEFASGATHQPVGYGLRCIDHLAHAVYGGRMSYWSQLYERLFGPYTLRCHDIRTAGVACASTEGIRHIALRSDNMAATMAALHETDAGRIELAQRDPLSDGGHADSDACLLLRMCSNAGVASIAVEFTRRIHPGPVYSSDQCTGAVAPA